MRRCEFDMSTQMKALVCTETGAIMQVSSLTVFSRPLFPSYVPLMIQIPLPHLWAQMVQAKQETIELMHSVAAHTLALKKDSDYVRLFKEAPADPTLEYRQDCGYANFQAKVLKLLIMHRDWGTFREVWRL